MKKLNIMASLLMAIGWLAFSSCEDDNGSNPTINQPQTFDLNAPAMAGNVVDLKSTTATFDFTWKQPDYGYTAPVYYNLQLSYDGQWDTTIDENGVEVENYVEFEEIVTECKVSVDASTLNRLLIGYLGIESAEDVPSQCKVYVRIHAKLRAGYDCYSNVVEMNVAPYYQTLTVADPEIWYLIGGCVGDNSWSNDSRAGYSQVGTSIIPFSIIDGESYDELTGKGNLTYTGWFPAGGEFKFILNPGSWDDQMGCGEDGKPVHNVGTSGNFSVSAEGYYTIQFNTKNYTVEITPADAPREYGQMLISGSFNGWATDEAMEAAEPFKGEHNHIWKYKANWSEDTEFKFLVDSSWAPNWGTDQYNYGIGVSNGPNIPALAGNYVIVFNDITGFYQVLPVEE